MPTKVRKVGGKKKKERTRADKRGMGKKINKKVKKKKREKEGGGTYN